MNGDGKGPIEYVTHFPGRDDGAPWTQEQADTAEGATVYSPDGEQELGKITRATAEDDGGLVIIYALTLPLEGRLALDYDDEKVHRALLLKHPIATF